MSAIVFFGGFLIFAVFFYVLIRWSTIYLVDWLKEKKKEKDLLTRFEEITKVTNKIEEGFKRINLSSEDVLKKIDQIREGGVFGGLFNEQMDLLKEMNATCMMMVDFTRIHNDFVNAIYHDIGFIKRNVLMRNIETVQNKKGSNGADRG